MSLGSNQGDSLALLREAVAQLGTAVDRVSAVYRTAPWGPVPQDDFLNITLLAGDPDLDAAGWLARCHDLERAAGRERLVRWGPRTLDADVIGVWRTGAVANVWAPEDAIVSDDPELTLPHPRAAERGFVLVPWAEIQPDAVLPGYGPIAKLVEKIDITSVERVGPLAYVRGDAAQDPSVPGGQL